MISRQNHDMDRLTLQGAVHHICSCSKLRQTFPALAIASTSEDRNLRNLATSTTTERKIPEVICEVRLAGSMDRRQNLSEVSLSNGAGPGQTSESDSGPTHCKHSLMEGSGAHMNGRKQTHTYERLQEDPPRHTLVHSGR